MSFFPTLSRVKKQQRPARFKCLKTYGFRACVQESIISPGSGRVFYLPGFAGLFSDLVHLRRTQRMIRCANIALDKKRLRPPLDA